MKENTGDLWSGTGDREIAIGAWTYRCRTRRLALEQYRVSKSSIGHLEGIRAVYGAYRRHRGMQVGDVPWGC